MDHLHSETRRACELADSASPEDLKGTGESGAESHHQVPSESESRGGEVLHQYLLWINVRTRRCIFFLLLSTVLEPLGLAGQIGGKTS